jgi:transcriptional regulator with XRE-family HTH domain
MHRESIAQLERGRRKPTWASVLAIADALGVSLEAFRDRPEASKPNARKRTQKRS